MSADPKLETPDEIAARIVQEFNDGPCLDDCEDVACLLCRTCSKHIAQIIAAALKRYVGRIFLEREEYRDQVAALTKERDELKYRLQAWDDTNAERLRAEQRIPPATSIHDQGARSSTYADLVGRCETLADQIEPHAWDNLSVWEQRDWLLAHAVEQLQSLKDSVWPGKPKWKPTAAVPQQDFYEAFVESLRATDAEREAALKQIPEREQPKQQEQPK